MRNYLKKVIYLIVFIGFSSSFAGSYDDFFKAIEFDDVRTVEQLLQRGFDPNTPNPKGQYALHLALREPSPKVLALLLNQKKIQFDARTPQDESPLMLAALKGEAEAASHLIELGADVNKPGWTPLHYAATGGHLALIRLLLAHDAYIDAESPNGTTPLMMAAMYSTPSAVKLLLESGADPLLTNNLGLSALDFAQRASRHDSATIIEAFANAAQAATAPPKQEHN
jgi:ankyrin repeat protein